MPCHRYLAYSGDRATLQLLLPGLHDIVDHHLQGTGSISASIRRPDLPSQGQEGYQLTWMDAKVGDWVVTPRRGKAVEINALWYNSLRLMQRWVTQEKTRIPRDQYGRTAADQAQRSFNDRFWSADGQYLYHVIDTPKAATIFPSVPTRFSPISLGASRAPLRKRGNRVLDVVPRPPAHADGACARSRPGPGLKPRTRRLRARDAAYHQGTVWAWLIGPFIDAWLRVHPDYGVNGSCVFLKRFPGPTNSARPALARSARSFKCRKMPYLPRGCVAQAWSVA